MCAHCVEIISSALDRFVQFFCFAYLYNKWCYRFWFLTFSFSTTITLHLLDYCSFLWLVLVLYFVTTFRNQQQEEKKDERKKHFCCILLGCFNHNAQDGAAVYAYEHIIELSMSYFFVSREFFLMTEKVSIIDRMAANKINIHNANGQSSGKERFRKKQANKFWNLIRSIYFCGIFPFKLMHKTTILCALRLWLGSFQSPRFQFNRKRDSILIYSFHRTNSWHNRLTLYSIMYSDLVFYPSHHVSFGVFFHSF